MLFGVCMPCLAYTVAMLSVFVTKVWHTLQANVLLLLSSSTFDGQPADVLQHATTARCCSILLIWLSPGCC